MKRGRAQIDDSKYPLFITTTITDFIPVFRDMELAKSTLELLEERRIAHDMRIYAYVLMLNHFQAIIHAPKQGESSRFIASWKSLSARLILQSVPSRWRSVFAEAARTYGEPSRKTHKVWMSRFDDLALFDQTTFITKLNYIHRNPVKAGLAPTEEDFVLSSARFYIQERRDAVITLTDCRPLLQGGYARTG
jgi:REP element-mobilizing transposase RayT